MTFELLVFAAFSTAVLVVLSVLIFLIGFPFGMELRTAFAIAIYVFVVLLPGGMNLWIAATGNDGEDVTERMTAGVRGLAMICGWTAVLFLFAPSNPYSQYLSIVAVTSLFLFIWSIWREDRHETGRRVGSSPADDQDRPGR